MIQLIIFGLFLILTISPTLASGITVDPASIMDSWHNINHWQGVTAGAITMGLLATSWKMKPLNFKVASCARAFVMYFACFIAFCFFFAEYFAPISAVLITIISVF